MEDLNKHRGSIAKMMDAQDDECKMYQEQIERLKAAFPVRLGPVVEIATPAIAVTQGDDYTHCAPSCDFCDGCPFSISETVPYTIIYKPGPNCPRPAPAGHEWRLALFAKSEEGGDESNSE